jgi:hypothetical protein
MRHATAARDLDEQLRNYMSTAGHGWRVLRIDIFRTSKASSCTAFVTFDSTIAARQFVASYLAKYKSRCFRCCERRDDLRSLDVRPLPTPPAELWMDEWRVYPGPEKHHVEWDYLNISRTSFAIRHYGLVLLLFPLLLYLSFAISIAGKIITFTNTFFTNVNADVRVNLPQHNVLPKDTVPTKECAVFCTFLSKYIPTLVQFVLLVVIIPGIIDLVSPFEGHFLRNRMYHSVLRKNLWIALLATLIAPTFGLFNAQYLCA